MPQGGHHRKDLRPPCGTRKGAASYEREQKLMAEKEKNRQRADRARRRAEALRENLRRRKLQARTRNAASGKADAARPDESGPESGKR